MRAPGARSFLLAVPAALAACLSQANPGYEPPDDALMFPIGLLLDPRVSTQAGPECGDDGDCEGRSRCASGVCREPARWLFVSNANSDLRFNASTLVAIDLDAFSAAIDRSDPEALAALQGPEDPVDDDRPCRFLANEPQASECTEAPFIAESATVHLGHFSATVAGFDPDPGDDRTRLLVPVRGDPSVTWIDVAGGSGGDPLRFECGQGPDSGEDDPRKCADDHRLRWLLDDPDLDRIGNEPHHVLVSPTRDLAYVTHAADVDLALIDLAPAGGDAPVLAERQPLLVPDRGVFPGGLGLAERPCDPENAPAVTYGCERTLVYAGMRYQRTIVLASTYRLTEDDLAAQQHCVGPSGIGEPGGVLCGWKFEAEGATVKTAGISPGAAVGAAQLGDLAFSEDGNELFAVQTNPGGLIRYDTSIDALGETRDVPAGVVELCPRATAMAIYRDRDESLALVSCYRSGSIFAVDLRTLGVVAAIQAGTGPHQLVVDPARERAYVANTLEASISAIDLSRASPHRFAEVARLGLQEPYSR